MTDISISQCFKTLTLHWRATVKILSESVDRISFVALEEKENGKVSDGRKERK